VDVRRSGFVGFLLVAALAACGGGGGSDDGPATDDRVAPDDVPADPGTDPGADLGPRDPGSADDGMEAPDDAVAADEGVGPDLGTDPGVDTGKDTGNPDVPCVPDCTNRICGSDGCSDVCGYCLQGYLCTTDGTCELFCRAQCDGKVCGPDECGGFCPPGCAENEECSPNFACVLKSCDPKCDGKTCGPDGCGDVCGTCGEGLVCTPQGACTPDLNCYDVTATGRCVGNERQWCESALLQKEACDTAGGYVCGYDNLAKRFVCRLPEVCQPQCTGKQCGPDGCPGGNCGTCAVDQACSTGGQCGEPCGDVTANGLCLDQYTLAFCHQGILLRYDCFAASKQCGLNPEQGVYDCI
jgi:hypothetical protein